MIAIRNHGMEISIDPQLCIQGITRVHLHMITSTPEKSLPLLHLKTSEINTTITPEIKIFSWEVSPNDRDQIHLIIKRSSGRKIGSGTTNDALPPGKRRLNCIQRHGTNN